MQSFLLNYLQYRKIGYEDKMIEFFAVSFIIMLAAISPGPDFAMVVKNTLDGNRASGISTALGISCSLIIHAIYCMLGLAFVISQSLLLFSIIKYMGAAYLIYIGIKSLREKSGQSNINEKIQINKDIKFKSFKQGLLCNLLNPKAIMFILAFFTLVIKPSTSFNTQLLFAIEIALIHLIWFSCLAIIITHKLIRNRLIQIQYYIVKMLGIALIGFGAKIATLSHSIG